MPGVLGGASVPIERTCEAKRLSRSWRAATRATKVEASPVRSQSTCSTAALRPTTNSATGNDAWSSPCAATCCSTIVARVSVSATTSTRGKTAVFRVVATWMTSIGTGRQVSRPRWRKNPSSKRSVERSANACPAAADARCGSTSSAPSTSAPASEPTRSPVGRRGSATTSPARTVRRRTRTRARRAGGAGRARRVRGRAAGLVPRGAGVNGSRSERREVGVLPVLVAHGGNAPREEPVERLAPAPRHRDGLRRRPAGGGGLEAGDDRVERGAAGGGGDAPSSGPRRGGRGPAPPRRTPRTPSARAPSRAPARPSPRCAPRGGRGPGRGRCSRAAAGSE